VDTGVFAPGNRGGRRQTRYLLAVGRLDDPRKNLPLLIEAFARISPRNPNVELRLVGPLEDRTWLDARDRTLGIAHQVRYLGELSLPELVRQYQDAEAVVLSSRQEGFGMALVEAMACGTPVVSTRCGGPEEIVRDGITGFLTPVGDAVALAEAAERILSDRALRASMGRAAREDVCNRFAMEVIGAQVLRRYHEAYPELPE
jgi:glycosyltransferase involved in cell wall biosynthesis